MTLRTRWLLPLALAVLPALAPAHNLSVAHVDVSESSDGGPRVEVDLALRDLALALPLDANRDEQVTWGELEALRGPLESLVADKLRLSNAAGACTLHLDRLGVRNYDDGAYAALDLRADCAGPGRLRLDYALFFDSDPQHRALVTSHRGSAVATAIVHSSARSIELPEPGGSPFLAFLHEGVAHILSGYDHLAFLLSLLLPAPLVLVAGAWRPAQNWRGVLWPTLGLVTAFTAAHSITLSIAALGWVQPSSYWVEGAIAASVLLAALNNLYPLVTRRLWMVGFGFGLVHGLGFAGALLETGLPTNARLSALFGFNLGVEIGQLGVVAIALPALYLLSDSRGYANFVLRLASAAIALLASWWLLQRMLG